MTTNSAHRRLPKHRAGYRSKVKNLEAYLRDSEGNVTSDPLSGNYQLLKESQIVTLTQAPEFAPQAQIASLVWAGSDTFPTLEAGAALPSQLNDANATVIDVVSGDFDQDGKEEVVALYVEGGNGYVIMLSDGLFGVPGPPICELGQINPPYALVAYQDTGFAVFSLDSGGNLQQQTIQVDKGLDCRTTGSTISMTGASEICAVAVDTDGSGVESTAIAWAVGGQLYAGVVRGNGELYLSPAMTAAGSPVLATFETDGTPGKLAIARGSFDGSPRDQFAVSWIDAADEYHAASCVAIIFESGGSLAMGPVLTIQCDGGPAIMASGDLDGSATDHLVACCRQTNGNLYVQVFGVDSSSYQLTSCGSPGFIYATEPSPDPGVQGALAAINPRIVVGAVGEASGGGPVMGAVPPCIVIRSSGIFDYRESFNQFSACVATIVIFVGHDLSLPPQLVDGLGITDGPSPGVLTDFWISDSTSTRPVDVQPYATFLTLADLTGQSILVGTPTYKRVEAASGILVAINAPPSQLDDSGNQDPANSFAIYCANKEQDLGVELDVTRSWTTSDEITANAGGPGASISASLTQTYGSNFENSTEAFSTVKIGTFTQAQTDDSLICSVTDYDLWEYPVYQPSEPSTVIGHLLVVFPDLSSSGNAPMTAVMSGTDKSLGYSPAHLPLQVMSYPTQSPADCASVLMANVLQASQNMSNYTISWSNVQSETASKSSRASLKIGASVSIDPLSVLVPGLDFGVDVEFSGDYSQSQVSSHEVSFTEDTSIQIQYGTLNNTDADFATTIYVYWSAYNGALVVDYSVQVDTATTTYWTTNFTEPKPCIWLPWNKTFSANSTEPDEQLLTPDIGFATDSTGQLRAYCKVSNFSLTAAPAFDVTFYSASMNPIADPPTLPADANPIGKATVSDLAPQGRAVASVAFPTTAIGETCAVYCQIEGYTHLGSLAYRVYPNDHYLT